MDNLLRRALMLLSLMAFAYAGEAFAQQDIGLRITALTSAERDALQASLRQDGLRIVVACVPAGVLLVRSSARSTQSAEALRTQVRGTLSRVVRPERVVDDRLTEADIDHLCDAARNQ